MKQRFFSWEMLRKSVGTHNRHNQKKSDIKMKIGGLYPPSLQYTLVREKSQSVSCAWKCWSTTNLTWGGLQRTCTTGQNHAAGLSRNLPDIKYQSNPLQGHLCCECIIYSVSRSCNTVLIFFHITCSRHLSYKSVLETFFGYQFTRTRWISKLRSALILRAASKALMESWAAFRQGFDGSSLEIQRKQVWKAGLSLYDLTP